MLAGSQLVNWGIYIVRFLGVRQGRGVARRKLQAPDSCRRSPISSGVQTLPLQALERFAQYRGSQARVGPPVASPVRFAASRCRGATAATPSGCLRPGGHGCCGRGLTWCHVPWGHGRGQAGPWGVAPYPGGFLFPKLGRFAAHLCRETAFPSEVLRWCRGGCGTACRRRCCRLQTSAGDLRSPLESRAFRQSTTQPELFIARSLTLPAHPFKVVVETTSTPHAVQLFDPIVQVVAPSQPRVGGLLGRW